MEGWGRQPTTGEPRIRIPTKRAGVRTPGPTRNRENRRTKKDDCDLLVYLFFASKFALFLNLLHHLDQFTVHK